MSDVWICFCVFVNSWVFWIPFSILMIFALKYCKCKCIERPKKTRVTYIGWNFD